MNLFSRQAFSILGAIFALGASFLLGIQVGKETRPAVDTIVGLENKDTGLVESTDFAPFWLAWRKLNEKYIFPDEVKTEDKIWGAIEGLASSFGDPYTSFFPPVEAEVFEESIRGNFEGVGMEIGLRDDILTVISPLKNSPAEKAGMLPGDKILKINDVITTGMTVEDAVKNIRGPGGTEVKLLVYREETAEPFEVKIIRAVINLPTLETEKRDDGVFVIELYSFTEKSPDLFRNALREFVESKYDKLLLDLRGNPGGYLEAAVHMASWFLPAGKVVVKEDFGDRGEGEVYRSHGQNIFNEQLKMVILVNGGSASASEILAGALSEHGIATLVGEKTFGKGSVQEVVGVTEDTFLKITVARWLTPNDVSISENGLKPDIEVPYTAEDRAKKLDPQLDKAVEILKEMKL